MKHATRTTEFWVLVACFVTVMVLTFLQAYGFFPLSSQASSVAIFAVTTLGTVYILSRSLVKSHPLDKRD